MGYKVHITEVATGITRESHIKWDWYRDGMSDEFWWTEGNFGCDCNRRMEFRRAGGDPEIEDSPCSPNEGPQAYRVTHAILDDGTRVDIDGEPQPPREVA